jgi:hypothetical protein
MTSHIKNGVIIFCEVTIRPATVQMTLIRLANENRTFVKELRAGKSNYYYYKMRLGE